MVTFFIRRYIAESGQLGKIFTSAELIEFGRRNSVDKALSRLVKSGELIRIARGMFIKANAGEPMIKFPEAAAAKAERFSRQLFEHAQAAAHLLGLSGSLPEAHSYAIAAASSSSFQCGTTTVQMQGACARKTAALGQTKVARTIRALWHLGKNQVDAKMVRAAAESFAAADKAEFQHSARHMPSWLWDLFAAWRW